MAAGRAQADVTSGRKGRLLRAGERFATIVVDPRTKRRTLAVTGVLLGLLVLQLGFFAGARIPLLVALALLPVAVFVPLALWIDRHEPEPRWLLFVTFLWGASAATAVAYVLNSVGGEVVGIGLGAEAGDIYGTSVSAPIVEELAKGAVLLFIFVRRRHALSGVLDALVYATMVGLGFATTENVLYYAREEDLAGVFGTFVLRGVLTPLLHPLFTAMTAIGLVLALRSSQRRVQIGAPVVGLLLAIGLHSLWNSADLAGLAGTAFAALFCLALLAGMIVVVRISMRQEAAIVRDYLPTGIVDRDEVEKLFWARTRLADAWAAFRSGGWRAVRARDDYIRSLSALAFRNHRAALASAQSETDSDPVSTRYRGEVRRLLAAVSPTEAEAEREGDAAAELSAALKTCPDCTEQVKDAARVCRHCGYRFEPATSVATGQPA